MSVRSTEVAIVKSKSSRVLVAGKRAALTRAAPPWLSRELTSSVRDRGEIRLVIPALVASPLGEPSTDGLDPGRLESSRQVRKLGRGGAHEPAPTRAS
jgi:hypothetical protein